MVTTLDERASVARVRHRCNMCSRRVVKGETYYRQTNVGDNGLYNWKTCQHCELLLHIYPEITAYADDEGYGPDQIADWSAFSARAQLMRARWAQGWTRPLGDLYPHPTNDAEPLSQDELAQWLEIA